MARGWESKSVESQMEEASGAQPNGHNHPLTEADKHRKRERENLILARARVLQQLEASSNERYKKLLQQELSDLERKLHSN
jgi:hypothetical protein